MRDVSRLESVSNALGATQAASDSIEASGSRRRECLHAGVLAASSSTVENQPTVCVTPTGDRYNSWAQRRAPAAITLKDMTDDLII